MHWRQWSLKFAAELPIDFCQDPSARMFRRGGEPEWAGFRCMIDPDAAGSSVTAGRDTLASSRPVCVPDRTGVGG